MSFLSNLQCCSDKKAQSSADAEVEIQLEVGPRKGEISYYYLRRGGFCFCLRLFVFGTIVLIFVA